MLAPSTRSSSLRAEIIAGFHDPSFDSDLSLLQEVPSDQATHNTFFPLQSPLFTPSEFSSPTTTVSETDVSQFFTTPPLTPIQNSFSHSHLPPDVYQLLQSQKCQHTQCPCTMSAQLLP